MKSWREIFGEAPAWLIILGFSAGATLLGFDLAIFLAYYGSITSVAPLMATALGSAVGAAIAASATLYAATYNQRRSERRELRPEVRAVEREINGVYGKARAVHAAILTYKDGDSDVTTTMDKEFIIKDLRIVSPDAKSSLQPQLGKSAQGFLMTGFRADYVGKTPAETTKLHVDIAYQEVSGLQIPSRIHLDGSSGGNSFGIDMVLSGCQVTRK
jgi:hypothetical protein